MTAPQMWAAPILDDAAACDSEPTILCGARVTRGGPVRYHGSDTPVFVGDYVEFRDPWFFRRRWRTGRVVFVPGLSQPNPSVEFGGDWVVVREPSGAQTGVVVDPRTRALPATVRFIRRSDDDLRTTTADIPFFG